MLGSLAEALDRFAPADSREAADLDVIRRFVALHPDPFDRRIPDAHCTASAFVISSDFSALLFVYHRKLERWLQPGGHGEPGELTAEEIALREAREETGIAALTLHPAAPRPFDVDVHRIPDFPGTAAHDHLDLRYVVIAAPGSEPAGSVVETRGARWFTWDQAQALDHDAPTLRAIRKLKRLVGTSAHPPGPDARQPTLTEQT